MRTNGKQPVVLLALNRVDQATDITYLRAAGVNTIECGRGCFDGKVELCYAIPVEEFTEHVRSVLRECDQKAVFFLDNQYNAWLATAENDYIGYNTDDHAKRAVYAGEFKEVPQTVAFRHKGYSEFGGKYYVAGR